MATEQPGVPLELTNKWDEDFTKDKARVVAQKACTQFATMTLLTSQSPFITHVFNTKVKGEVKPVTDQKNSGRCWLYAALNLLRIHFCRKYNLEEFEFSQTYLFFWDKVERCNYLLSSFIKLAKEGADYNDRTVSHLLTNPTNDGGQWQMVVNLIEKYGLIPQKMWRSPHLAENSSRFGTLLNNQIRSHCATLMSMVKDGRTDGELLTAKDEMMKSLYNVISICLGSPPKTVEFDCYDKDKQCHKIGPITPLQFYKELVKPLCNLEDMVCLTNDPRTSSSYYKLYTVAYLNNMNQAKKVMYINVPIDILKKYTRIALENDQPVWFGCDVTQDYHRKESVLSTTLFDYEALFGISTQNLDKAGRLLYKDSEMTHAMLFTGCHIEEVDGEKKVTKWRVENTYGETKNDGKGYLVMTDDWFDQHMFEVAIDKKYLPDHILEILKQEPIELPAWDPMGALA